MRTNPTVRAKVKAIHDDGGSLVKRLLLQGLGIGGQRRRIGDGLVAGWTTAWVRLGSLRLDLSIRANVILS